MPKVQRDDPWLSKSLADRVRLKEEVDAALGKSKTSAKTAVVKPTSTTPPPETSTPTPIVPAGIKSELLDGLSAKFVPARSRRTFPEVPSASSPETKDEIAANVEQYQEAKTVTREQIARLLWLGLGIGPSDLKGTTKTNHIASARWAFWVLVRCARPGRSFRALARDLRDFDRTTVRNGFGKFPKKMGADESFAGTVRGIAESLGLTRELQEFLENAEKK